MNNLEVIKPLLVFEDDDTFYHLQVLQRKKENSNLGSNSYVIKTYYISSIEYLESKMLEIFSLCNLYNARAYINLNKRSFEKIALQNLKKITDCILNKNYRGVRKSYESVAGSFSSDAHKKWIIDIDYNSSEKFFKMLKAELTKMQPVGDKFIARIYTKHGYHMITTPFNISEFNELFRNMQDLKPDIHKNNPTLLYCVN